MIPGRELTVSAPVVLGHLDLTETPASTLAVVLDRTARPAIDPFTCQADRVHRGSSLAGVVSRTQDPATPGKSSGDTALRRSP